jgi:Protein of unknown function (DUF992)
MPHATTVVAATLAAASLMMSVSPAAQAQAQQGGTVRIGALRCDVAGNTAFVFGSTRNVTCDFTNINGRHERYSGEISRYGVDLGFTQSAVMLWGVLAPTTDVQPGVLAGTFGGVSAGVTAGVGVAANVLVGGSDRSIQLQPISIEGNTGLNIGLGVAELRLQAAQ